MCLESNRVFGSETLNLPNASVALLSPKGSELAVPNLES